MKKKYYKWIVLILVIAIVDLIYRNMKRKELGMPKDNPGNPGTKLIEPLKSTRILSITLTVKSTPERLPSGKPTFNELRVSAPTGNSGVVYLADSPASCKTGPRYEVVAGQTIPIKVSELSKLFYYGTANDTLSIYAEVEE